MTLEAMPAPRRRVAVIGSGIAGLSTSYLLHRNNGVDVTLYEKEAVCGGHTLTDDSAGYPVDVGFQVFNLTTYPHLVGLLEELQVDSEPSEMSFSLSLDAGRLEWASHSLPTIFAQKRNLLSPSFWCMVLDVVRFGRQAPQVLLPENTALYGRMTVQDFFASHPYSAVFQQNYFLPMCAAVWSMPNSQVMLLPIIFLVRFWVNHHLLDLLQRPVWRVVSGRSRQYVARIVAGLPRVLTSTEVTGVRPISGKKVRVEALGQAPQEFDAVVLATHSDQALKLLGSSAKQEVRAALEQLPYNTSQVYLHTDASLMPRDRAVWASWNVIGSSGSSSDSSVCVTYWANRLQDLPPDAPDTFVTLNPPHPPSPSKTFRQFSMAHPAFGASVASAQKALSHLQGADGLYFAGAWCGYGFHEDGLKAGMEVAEALGATIPWTPVSTSPKISWTGAWFAGIFHRFACGVIRQGCLQLILPNGEQRTYGDKAAKLQATVRVLNMAFFRKVVLRHDTGLGEAYMDGDYETRDLGALMELVACNAKSIEGGRGALGVLNWLGNAALRLAHMARPNTLSGSRKNIEAHYDAGNDMYKVFLDESMTYSCAIYNTPEDSLHQAQVNKLQALVEAAGICAQDHVLEIGCGWGSLAIHAVQATGCKWTGLTISKAQLQEATDRVQAAGLTDRIQLLFCDYRDCQGMFDKVVSCEMVEAVGHDNLQAYMQAIGRLLKPGGTAVIQAICEPDERYEAYCRSSDFIREHVFPGGHLPSVGALVTASAGTNLSLHNTTDIGPHYARTLREWRHAWESKRGQVLALQYSERFWRKYRFYFAYCEAAFHTRYIHDYHLVWHKQPAAATTLIPAHHSSPMPLKTHSAAGAAAAATDPVIQVLLAVYFFLAGVAVSQGRWLWLIPSASIACAGLLAVFAVALRYLAPSCYRMLTGQQQAQRCADFVSLAFSSTACLAAALQLLSYAVDSPEASQQARERATKVVCIAAGFFAFRLWTLVHRSAGAAWSSLGEYTVLLCLFSAAAVKGLDTQLLVLSLLGEAHTMLRLLRHLQVGSQAFQATVEALQLPMLIAKCVVYIGTSSAVVMSAGMFAVKAHHIGACCGCAYLTGSTLMRTAHSMRQVEARKLHHA